MLPLVFSTPVLIRGFAYFVGLEKNYLSNPLIGVYLCGERGGIGKLQRDIALPLRLERSDIDNDAATGVSGLSEVDGQNIARNTKIFDGARKRKRIGWNEADVALHIDKRVGIEVLGIDDGGIDIGKQFEFIRAADIVPIARSYVGYDLVPVG